jgi:hypothetical protein
MNVKEAKKKRKDILSRFKKDILTIKQKENKMNQLSSLKKKLADRLPHMTYTVGERNKQINNKMKQDINRLNE